MPYFSVFGLKSKKKTIIFEISTLTFVKYKFLTHAVIFSMRCTFCKGLGSAFSQDLGQDPSLL